MASALNGPWHGRRVAGRAGSAPAPSWHHSSCGWAALCGEPLAKTTRSPPSPCPCRESFLESAPPPRGPQAAPLPSCGCGRPEDFRLEGAWAPPSVPSGPDRLLCAPRESWGSVLPRVCCHSCTHTCSVTHSCVHTCPHTGSHTCAHTSHTCLTHAQSHASTWCTCTWPCAPTHVHT